MPLICQGCQQRLPKTAVMCPNCGGREFLPDTYDAYQPIAQPPADANQAYVDSGLASDLANNLSNNLATHYPDANASFSQAYADYPQAYPLDEGTNQTKGFNQASGFGAGEGYAMPAATVGLPPTYASRRPASQMQYAGLLRRAIAYALDLLLVGIILGLGYRFGLPTLSKQYGLHLDEQTSYGLLGVGYWLLMALPLCLGRQATLGKIMMGLWVFGMRGQRLNVFHALWRELVKLPLLAGFFLLWFTGRKQTLHDLVARTVVLYD